MNLSFPGSAWERTAREALPPVGEAREAEPRRQPVPRRSLGTRNTRRSSASLAQEFTCTLAQKLARQFEA